MKYGLKDEHLRAILDVLYRHGKVEKAVLFGSRAMGTYTPESDVDICLFGDTLTLTDQARLMAAMEDLSIPQQVDLLLHRNIKEKTLLDHIRREGEVLFERQRGGGGGFKRGGEWRKLTVDEVKARTESAIAIGPFGSRMKAELYTPIGVRVIRGNNISDTHEACPYMTSEILSLFPSEFQDSELGEIPKGWVVSAAGDVITLEYGRALKAEARRPGSVIVFGSNGVVGRHDEALAKGPGIVVGRKGNPGIVTWAPSDFFVIDTAFYVTRKANVLGWHFLRHSLELMDLARLAADSAVPGVNRNAIYAQPLLQPSAAVAQRFEDLLASFSVVVGSRNAESAVLGATRDALLPKLLSGEISVSGAEHVLEALA